MTSLQEELEAVRTHAGIFPLDDRAFLRITGPDATRWLNGMVTNSIQSLKPGEGNYSFLLNAQGRIQGDCTIYREAGEEPTFLLETDASQVETIHRLLDKFIIMDDVEITSGLTLLGQPCLGMGLTGARAEELLRSDFAEINEGEDASPSLSIPKPGTMTYALLQRGKQKLLAQPNEGLLLVFRPSADSAVPRFDLWFQQDQDRQFARRKLESAGATDLTDGAQEAHRILSGVPRFGTDIRDRDLPQETGQDHALHFAKGCYLGQEIVERIRSRGQVHRVFTSFALEGEMPALPAPLTCDGKAAGELTSAVRLGDRLLALGYARREALDRNSPLVYDGGTASKR